MASEAVVRLAEDIAAAGYSITSFARKAMGASATRKRVDNERVGLQHILSGKTGLGLKRARRYAKALGKPADTYVEARPTRQVVAFRVTSLENELAQQAKAIAGMRKQIAEIRAQLAEIRASLDDAGPPPPKPQARRQAR